MTVIALIPILVAVVGLLLWMAATGSPRLQEIGRIAFVVGLFWTVAVFSHESVRVGDAPTHERR